MPTSDSFGVLQFVPGGTQEGQIGLTFWTVAPGMEPSQQTSQDARRCGIVPVASETCRLLGGAEGLYVRGSAHL